MIKNSTDFSRNVSSFLTDYLPYQRNYSKNTILSYRDSLKLFLKYLNNERHINISDFQMKDFTRELIIDFMSYLRNNGSSLSTANQRLSALKSFADFCQIDSIENIVELQRIMGIKSIKTRSKQINFLDENQTKKLINMPDTHTFTGLRHKVTLCLLYESAARVQELCDLQVGDVNLGKHPTVRLTGKGNKTRVVPISRDMADLLELYIDKCFGKRKSNSKQLIVNRTRSKISDDGVNYIINKYSDMIRKDDPSFPDKLSAHCLRHSKAMHMLASGINIVYIRDFLGHESITTTMVYAKANSRLKEDAIAKLEKMIFEENNEPDWARDEDLLAFLESLG